MDNTKIAQEMNDFYIEVFRGEDKTWCYNVYNTKDKIVLTDEDFDSKQQARESAECTLRACLKGKYRARLFK